MSAIATHQLSKHYRQGLRRRPVTALNQVTLEIPEGEIFGFLGPNGSGKTTLLKCLLHIAFPSAGEASVLGKPAGDLKTKRQIGFLPENPYFYDRFTGIELLHFYGALYGLDRAKVAARIEPVIEEVGLGMSAARRPLRTYSKGMLQRIGIAQAIVAEPQLIILDEPSTGLDPIGRRQIKDLIREYNRRGHTIFLNSHILEDIENLCHRVGIIHQGTLLAVETIASLTEQQERLVVRVRAWQQPLADAVADLTSVIEETRSGQIRLTLAAGVEPPELLRALILAGAELFSANLEVIRLEDRVLDLIDAHGGVPEAVRRELLVPQTAAPALPSGEEDAAS